MRQRTERRKTTEQKEKGKIIITKKKEGGWGTNENQRHKNPSKVEK